MKNDASTGNVVLRKLFTVKAYFLRLYVPYTLLGAKVFRNLLKQLHFCIDSSWFFFK